MANLQLFQRYSQAENVVTNNTLLLLQRVYQHSPAKFRQLMLSIWDGGHEAPEFGLRFAQQVRGNESVPDGVVVQESIKVAIETKLDAAFDPDQVRRHFSTLRGYTHRFALVLGTDGMELAHPAYAALRQEAQTQGIALAAISFATLMAKVRELYSAHHEAMAELVDDFEAFCDSFSLLPNDKWTMFVPPCGQSLEHNLSERLYYCSSDRSVRNTKYLGIYANKSVVAIGTISKVVSDARVDVSSGRVETKPGLVLSESEHSRIVRAAEAAQAMGWDVSSGHTFYLCDNMVPTDYRKGTPGGIQNRRYLDVRKALPVIPADLATLGEQLRTSRAWS